MSRLKEMIKVRKIKQTKLAVELKISRSAVSQQAKGGTTARKYADASRLGLV